LFRWSTDQQTDPKKTRPTPRQKPEGFLNPKDKKLYKKEDTLGVVYPPLILEGITGGDVKNYFYILASGQIARIDTMHLCLLDVTTLWSTAGTTVRAKRNKTERLETQPGGD